MKRISWLLLFFIFISINAQQILKNPKKPLNDNAGRVLNLTEVMRIDGEGEGYYYNGANELQIDKAGNIYLRDVWSSNMRAHLPKFSPDGRYLTDLYKQGEGPGEVQSTYDFALSEYNVYVFDYVKRKIIAMEQDGDFIKEFKIIDSFSEFIGVFEDWLVFSRRDRPFERKTSRLYDQNNVIVFISKKGKDKKDFYTFTNKEFYISLAQGGGWMSWDPFIITMGDNKLFACYTREYLIEVLDLKTGEIISKFKRDYPRIRYKMRDGEKKFFSKHNPPKKKHDTDIKNLFFNRGFLWVKTSTEDKKKGHLFDLFDSRGRFVDSFYVNIKGRILKIENSFLYSSESDEEGLPYIVKYKIEGNRK